MALPGFHFSHFGFFVHDVALMEDFYTRLFNFTVTDRGQLPTDRGTANLVFLSRNPDEHHQLVLISGRPETLDFNVINQISLKADSLSTLIAMYQRLLQEPDASELRPMTHGNALSLYVRDPEGNRLELYIDLPWYVSQPLSQPVDLGLDEAAILQQAEAHAQRLSGFMLRSEWRKLMAKKMGIETEPS